MGYRNKKVASRALKLKEIQQLISVLDGPNKLRDVALVTLLFRTGFRISEALSLRIEDVYQHGQVVETIAIAKQNVKGKTKSRVLPLHSEARAALAEHVASSLANGSLLGSKLFDITRQRASVIITKACAKAKIENARGLHAFRKRFCQDIYRRSGHDLFLTQTLMGHSSPTVTTRYLGVDEEKMRHVVLSEE